MRVEKRHRVELVLVIIWLVFTVSLASWWMIFGLRQADELRSADQTRAAEIEAVYRMLRWEGGVLIASLVAGGAALLWHIQRERRRHRMVEEFFAAFTHDLRTSLTSLRLQVESLQEDFAERSEDNPLLERLLKDSVRLQLQLDNSLFYANRREGKLHLQPVSLERSIATVSSEFPELDVHVEGEATLLADDRALESVLRNLFQNAVVHGNARRVEVAVAKRDSRVIVTVEDDGKGTASDPETLGRLFFRPSSSSGTGVGLYISRQLVERMRGSLTFSRGRQGLAAIIDVPEAGT